MAHPFYTIGHGTRPIGEFIDLIRSVEVTLLADVRTVPRSRTTPQYNLDTLPQSLAAFGIGHEHMAALGGLRSRAREVAPDRSERQRLAAARPRSSWLPRFFQAQGCGRRSRPPPADSR